MPSCLLRYRDAGGQIELARLDGTQYLERPSTCRIEKGDPRVADDIGLRAD